MTITRTGNHFENEAEGSFGVGFGAPGSLTVEGGSVLPLAGGTQGALLMIGRNAGGDGTVTVTGAGSALDMTGIGNADDPLGLQIGRNGGEGLLEVLDGARFTMTETEEVDAYIQIGRSADSLGTLRVSAAEMSVTAGDFLGIDVGREGGTGLLELLDGAEVSSTAGTGHRLRIGRDGGTGNVVVDDSTWTGRSLDTNSGLEVGAWDTGVNTGTLTLRNGAEMRLEGQTNSWSDIGRFEGNTGTLRIESGSTLEVRSLTSFADMNIGNDGGEGMLAMSGGGRLDIRADIDGWLLVGTNGATGRAVLEGAEVDIAGGRSAGLRVATRFSQDGGTGDGEVTLQNGTVMRIGGVESTDLFIAGEVGSRGVVEVLSGSEIELGANARIRVGQPRFEQQGGGEARLSIDGEGSIIAGARSADIGRDGGSGLLEVSDGGWLRLGGVDFDDWTNFEVGRGTGADGRAVIDRGFVTLQGANGLRPEGEGWEPYSSIGREGTGVLEIVGDLAADPDARHGYLQIGGADSAFSTIDIGRFAGGEGTVTIAGGFLSNENRGKTYNTETGAEVDLPGGGGGSSIRIGVDGGLGSLTVTEGGWVGSRNGETNNASLQVGVRGTGTAEFDASTLSVESEGSGARLLVGFQQGGDGTLRLANGTEARIESVGSSSFGLIGFEGGTGHLALAGAGTSLTLAGDQARLLLAIDDGSTGRLDVLSGAVLDAGDALFASDDGVGTSTVWLGGGTIRAGEIVMGEATFLGAGTLTDTGGADGFVTLTDTLLRLGDGLDAGGAVTEGIGTLSVEGAMTMTGGRAVFGFDGAQVDQLVVAGALTIEGAEIELARQGGTALSAMRLATASEGITLDGASLLTSGFDGSDYALELRAGDTELWAVGPTGPTVPVSVAVEGAGGAPLGGVTFSLVGADGVARTLETDQDGNPLLPEGIGGRLRAERDYSPGTDPAITTGSALEALRLAVGLNPSWGPASGETFIAADMNGDGAVTTADALEILRLAVGLAAEVAPRFVFIDAQSDLSGLSRTGVDFEEGVAVSDPSMIPSIQMTAILVGNVQEFA